MLFAHNTFQSTIPTGWAHTWPCRSSKGQAMASLPGRSWQGCIKATTVCLSVYLSTQPSSINQSICSTGWRNGTWQFMHSSLPPKIEWVTVTDSIQMIAKCDSIYGSESFICPLYESHVDVSVLEWIIQPSRNYIISHFNETLDVSSWDDSNGVGLATAA